MRFTRAFVILANSLLINVEKEEVYFDENHSISIVPIVGSYNTF